MSYIFEAAFSYLNDIPVIFRSIVSHNCLIKRSKVENETEGNPLPSALVKRSIVSDLLFLETNITYALLIAVVTLFWRRHNSDSLFQNKTTEILSVKQQRIVFQKKKSQRPF
jgi:hypothetical protein